MALLLGALIVHGIQLGPGIIAKEPALFWGLVASNGPLEGRNECERLIG